MVPENTLLRNLETNGVSGAYPTYEHPVVPAIDLNEQLVRSKPDTFYLRVNTDCMAGAGIHAGDMLIVDRGMQPGNGAVIIAMLDGDLLVRYYEQQQGHTWLVPATPTLSPINVSSAARFSVWGLVTYVVRKV